MWAIRVAAIVLFMVLQTALGQAATINWGTLPATDLTATTNTTTISGVTITTSGSTTDPASDGSRILQIMPAISTNGHTGGVVSQFDATTDNGSIRSSITITFSQPVSNVSFTVVDIDGGTGGSWNDNVQFSASPAGAYPTATFTGSNVTYNSATGLATANGAAISDTTGDLTVSYAGPVTTFTVTHIAANAAGTNPAGQFIMVDDVTFTPTPTTVKVQKITQWAVGGPFSFAVANLATTPANITTTAVNTATPATPTAHNVSTVGNNVTITETAASGFSLAGATCTDAHYLVTGNPSTSFGTLASNVLTIAGTNVKAGANITCVFTNARKPTVRVQKITQVATGGPFTFSATNLAAAIANITTSAVNTATPASPTAIDVSTTGTAVTITETPASGFALKSASCGDANAPGDGNPATVGSVSGNVLTIPADNVVSGASFTCVFTNTRLPAITLRKISIGGTGSFTLAGNNGVGTQILTTTADGVAVSGALTSFTTAGTVTTITETVPTGYALTAASCTGIGSGTAILAGNSLTLNAAATASGNNVTCTFTNSKLPTLTLSKTSVGGGGAFSFLGSNGFGADAITTPGGGGTVVGTTKILTAAATATTITETIPAGYAVTAISCAGLGSGGTATPNLAGGSVALDAAATAAGAAITCSFTNTKLPTLTLRKTSNSFTGSFQFAVTNASTSPVTLTTVSSGVAVTGSAQALTASALTGGSVISETLTTGFIMASATCTGLGSGGTATVNPAAGTITLDAAATAAGAAITCSFVNDAAAPAISVGKTAAPASVAAAGAAISYAITVSNTGNVPMSSISVSDPIGSATCPSSGSATIASLAVGASETCTLTYAATQADFDSNGGGDGDIDNTATASGTYAASPVSGSGSTAVTLALDPRLSIVKTADKSGPLNVGDIVTYTYTVTNAGNITMHNVTVNDTHNGNGTFTGPDNETLLSDAAPAGDSSDTPAAPKDGSWSTLAPGDKLTFTATYQVNQLDVDLLQ